MCIDESLNVCLCIMCVSVPVEAIGDHQIPSELNIHAIAGNGTQAGLWEEQ